MVRKYAHHLGRTSGQGRGKGCPAARNERTGIGNTEAGGGDAIGARRLTHLAQPHGFYVTADP